MLLVALEQLQAFLQQRLQLGILRIGDQRLAQGLIDRLMIRHFVVDIGLVERCPSRPIVGPIDRKSDQVWLTDGLVKDRLTKPERRRKPVDSEADT